MSVLSKLLVLVGLLSLFHAAYSAHEFSTLSSKLHRSSAATLPVDIQLETLISIVFACTGLVMGSESLKPISWSAWAGQIERDGGANPFHGLEDRVGFMDIRAKRKEFADWIRNQDRPTKS